MSKPLILTIGSLNIDYVTLTPRLPLAGETLTATSLTISPGGKGSNQAAACGRASYTSPSVQDVSVEMIGAVGRDDVYVEKLLFPTLRESGVGVIGVREVDGQTGTASIVVESEGGGENRIMVVGGANHSGMEDVKEVLERVEKVAAGRNVHVVVMQGEIPRATVLGLLKRFNGSGTKVVFNPAPVFEEGIPLDALKGLEVLVVNETEMILLGKALRGEGFEMGSVQKEEDLEEAELAKLADQFHTLAKVRTLLVTLGAKGVFYSVDDGPTGLVPGVKVQKVIDTTAAGDTFVGYFAVELARFVGSREGFEVKTVVERANRAAALCVQRPGAMTSIPFGYEL